MFEHKPHGPYGASTNNKGKPSRAANTYVLEENQTKSVPMSIQELVNQTDWTDLDIERIAQLQLHAIYKGDWPEDMVVRRVS